MSRVIKRLKRNIKILKIIGIAFIILGLIGIANICFGQQKDTAKPCNKCLPYIPEQLTDSTKFLSIADLNKYASKYQDVATYKEYQSFLNIINAIIKEAVADWNDKHKLKTKQ